MRAKQFFLIALLGIAACFGALIFLVAWEDPFFVLSGIGEDETAQFDNQRYQMPGLIRHQDYSAVVMGTSLVANYRASWFTEGLGEETLKITFPDGWISEFDTALDLAFRTHGELSSVYFCLDPNILIRPDSQRTVQLPAYLYNSNPLDDVEYLFNADTYALVLQSWLQRREDGGVTLDEAYVWDGTYTFSKAEALAGYVRPEVSGTILDADAYLDAAEENLDVVCGWIEAHPDTQFSIWFPPYSILYWDKMTREGSADAVITAVERAAERLLAYENVEVYCFLHAQSMITTLDYYTDHIHCSAKMTQWEAQSILAGAWRLTESNYKIRLDELREFVANYDYESIFQ